MALSKWKIFSCLRSIFWKWTFEIQAHLLREWKLGHISWSTFHESEFYKKTESKEPAGAVHFSKTWKDFSSNSRSLKIGHSLFNFPFSFDRFLLSLFLVKIKTISFFLYLIFQKLAFEHSFDAQSRAYSSRLCIKTQSMHKISQKMNLIFHFYIIIKNLFAFHRE